MEGTVQYTVSSDKITVIVHILRYRDVFCNHDTAYPSSSQDYITKKSTIYTPGNKRNEFCKWSNAWRNISVFGGIIAIEEQSVA